MHYSVVNSTFIPAEVAERHGIVRSDNRAIFTISVIDPEGESREIDIDGSFKNLLGQTNPLTFKTVKEPDAVYAIANFRFISGEALKFEIEVKLPTGARKFSLERKIYSPS